MHNTSGSPPPYAIINQPASPLRRLAGTQSVSRYLRFKNRAAVLLAPIETATTVRPRVAALSSAMPHPDRGPLTRALRSPCWPKLDSPTIQGLRPGTRPP